MTKKPARSGLSLLEVIVALTIFLLSVATLSHLWSLTNEIAEDTRLHSLGNLYCESKMAEAVAGIQPLSGVPEETYEDNPNWTWTMQAEQESIANLWTVTVTFRRQRTDGSSVECTYSRMILDPSVRGSTMDPSTADVAATTTGSTPTTQPPTGGGTQPPTGGGTQPPTKPPTGGGTQPPSGGGGQKPPTGGGAQPPTGGGGQPKGGRN